MREGPHLAVLDRPLGPQLDGDDLLGLLQAVPHPGHLGQGQGPAGHAGSTDHYGKKV